MLRVILVKTNTVAISAATISKLLSARQQQQRQQQNQHLEQLPEGLHQSVLNKVA
jgi:hypothetical protein